MSTPDPGWQRGLQDASPYLTVGIQLAGTMLVYIGLGWLVDRWLDTQPAFLIVGSVVGMVAFFVQLVRLTKELSSRTTRQAKPNDQEDDTDASGSGAAHGQGSDS